MGRRRQVVLVSLFLPLCWLGMMAVHELGHVLGLWATGGTVAKVVLHPLTISRTDPGVDPHPLAVVWAGPAVGVLLPLAAYVVAHWLRVPGSHLLRFFAGFCLIANGCYLGMGVVDAVGDARELLRLGTPAWQLGLFGAVAAPAGLYLWHGQGRHFRAENIGRYSILTVGGLLFALVTAEILFSPTQ